MPSFSTKSSSLLGLSEGEITEQFGHMLEAFEFGAPPHGGIALGIDRLVMLLAGGETIRDVIAFPKMQNGQDVLMRAPSPVSEEQLRESTPAATGAGEALIFSTRYAHGAGLRDATGA